MSESIQEKITYSLDEICELSSLSKTFLSGEIRAKKLKIRRAGRRVLILKSDFLAYLNKEENDDKER